MNQCEQIIEYLKTNTWIDPMTALREIGTMKLATRISELKERGYNFKDEVVYYQNYLGQEKHYKRYSLKDKEND